MSVTNLNIAVKIEGADEAAGKLQRVENAAEKVGSKSEKAGGLVARFEEGVKKLDDAVDKVEKPMRTFSGALDIASLALGAGLAGPLGQVIQQFGELVKSVVKAIEVTADYEDSAEKQADALKKVAAAQQVVIDKEAQRLKATQSLTEQALTTFRRNVGEGADQIVIEQVRATASALSNTQTSLNELTAEYAAGKIQTVDYLRRQAELQQGIKINERELKALGAATDSIATKQDAAGESTDRATKKVEQQKTTLKGIIEAFKELDGLVERAKADTRASQLTRKVEDGVGSVTDSLLPTKPRTVEDILKEQADELNAEFEREDLAAAARKEREQQKVREATTLEKTFNGLAESAVNLESVGVQALQGFSQAAGQAIASLIIDGDKAGVSFRKLAGQVAAGLSAQAFGYAVFLSALGVATALTGFALPGFNSAQLFAGAGVMAATGAVLAGTARALGASTVGGSSSAASSGASGGGAQDRVSSFSAGGGGAAPVNVTVVLGVDEVSNVLVRQSQREARAGSLSSSRLAVV